jgi:hypothetical protein
MIITYLHKLNITFNYFFIYNIMWQSVYEGTPVLTLMIIN